MQCPFLQETRVGRCTCSSQRKMIARPATDLRHEKCSSPDYATCGIFLQQSGGDAAGSKCPFLDERPVQFCSAASVVKYVPYTESLLSRCGTDAHRYCDLHMALSHAGRQAGDQWAGDLRFAAALLYTRNHMWLDPGTDGTWHAGIDALLAKVLAKVDQITFLTASGVHCPTAVLTVRGIDLPMVFPFSLPITATHAHLRARPSDLTADPYGRGWLFEGTAAETGSLMTAAEAARWAACDVDRLSAYVHAHLARTVPAFQADGGEFSHDMFDHLGREQLLGLFHDFFSPDARGDTQS